MPELPPGPHKITNNYGDETLVFITPDGRLLVEHHIDAENGLIYWEDLGISNGI